MRADMRLVRSRNNPVRRKCVILLPCPQIAQGV